jgi:NTE family protein
MRLARRLLARKAWRRQAETSPDVLEYRSDHVPVMSKAMGALIDVPINRYSFDTIRLMQIGVAKYRQDLRTKPRDPDSPFAPDADIYFINASLAEIADPDERASLMKIPTTLYLTDAQIDRLLLAGSRLIRNSSEFQRLMTDLQSDR